MPIQQTTALRKIAQLQRKYVAVRGGQGCFTEGTLIHTPLGYKPINLIKKGDLVYSLNQETKLIQEKKVLKCFMYGCDIQHKMIIFVLSNGTQIKCTENHEFYFESNWITASKLARRTMELCKGHRFQIHNIDTWQANNAKVQKRYKSFVYEASNNKGGLQSNCNNNKFESKKYINSQISSSSVYTESRKQGAGKSHRLQSFKQLFREFRMDDSFRKYNVFIQFGKIQRFFKSQGGTNLECEINGTTSNRDTSKVQAFNLWASKISRRIWSKGIDNKRRGITKELDAREININEIQSISFEDSSETVYDLCVEDNANYIITKNNIVVHNSSKTYSILILLINHASSKPNRDIYIVSAELTKMRDTVIKDFVNVMRSAGIFDENRFLAGREYRYPNGSNIKFIGLDKEDVGKGLRSHVVYFNEVNKVNQETFRQMATRSDKIYLDYNPDAEFYVDTDIIPRSDCDFVQLTFEDNELLKAGEKEEILNYYTLGYNSDGSIKNKYQANLWQVYGLGNIGNLQGVIFENWTEVKSIPEEAEFISYGMDFGFTNDPSTLIAMYRYNGGLYLKELLYETKLTNSDIVLRLEALGIKKHQMIIADCAEPKSIEDIRRAGYRIEPAKKGADSVKNGIDTLQQYQIFITECSLNGKKEARNYRWATDKDGKQLNVPEDSNNHFWDAVRYAGNRLKKSTFIIQ